MRVRLRVSLDLPRRITPFGLVVLDKHYARLNTAYRWVNERFFSVDELIVRRPDKLRNLRVHAVLRSQ